MLRLLSKVLAGILSVCAIDSLAFPQCSMDVVLVSGRVEPAPPQGLVRVQLVYPKQRQKMGESGEVTVEGGSFRIQIPFVTQSPPRTLIGDIRERCNRRPSVVVVTLKEGDQEEDRISLDFSKDFKVADASAYSPRSEILLHGPPGTTSIR
jgi:hypothetical protein